MAPTMLGGWLSCLPAATRTGSFGSAWGRTVLTMVLSLARVLQVAGRMGAGRFSSNRPPDQLQVLDISTVLYGTESRTMPEVCTGSQWAAAPRVYSFSCLGQISGACHLQLSFSGAHARGRG